MCPDGLARVNLRSSGIDPGKLQPTIILGDTPQVYPGKLRKGHAFYLIRKLFLKLVWNVNDDPFAFLLMAAID